MMPDLNLNIVDYCVIFTYSGPEKYLSDYQTKSLLLKDGTRTLKITLRMTKESDVLKTVFSNVTWFDILL